MEGDVPSEIRDHEFVHLLRLDESDCGRGRRWLVCAIWVSYGARRRDGGMRTETSLFGTSIVRDSSQVLHIRPFREGLDKSFRDTTKPETWASQRKSVKLVNK